MKPRSGRIMMAAITVIALALVSWGFKQSPGAPQQKQTIQDTIPKKQGADREKKIRDLDEALEELNNIDLDEQVQKAMLQVEQAMKNIDEQKLKAEIDLAMKSVNMNKIKAEMNNAMKGLDMQKLQAEIAQSIQGVNIDKAMQEAKESLAKINWNEIKAEQEKALAEAGKNIKEMDFDKVKAEVDAAMKQVDMQKIQLEVASALRSVDIEKAMAQAKESMEKIDWNNIKADIQKTRDADLSELTPQIRKSMDEAKVQIEKAKEEIGDYKSFVDGLDADGLINKKEDYTIRQKDGDLIINGKKASAATIQKYSRFLEKYNNFSIRKNEDGFHIDRD